jgi:hypothetical protein
MSVGRAAVPVQDLRCKIEQGIADQSQTPAISLNSA